MTRAHLFVALGVVVLGAFTLAPTERPRVSNLSTAVKVAPTNPVAHQSRPHLDHSAYFSEPIETGQQVTAKCLECHEDSAKQVMKTAHFTWLSGDVQRNGETIRTGKRNLVNNFCISVNGNWPSCTKCHAGYGWEDMSFDFTEEQNVDCLVCHDGSGTYAKGKSGRPAEGVDLAAVAGSVATPRRENCGVCHFNGGGGMGVKHGDLDDSLLNPSESLDVHMGKLGFLCHDCHETHEHRIPGKVNAAYTDATDAKRFDCTGCHQGAAHGDAVLNKHTERVACQACHIPAFARKYPTKMDWDWSKAGDSSREGSDPHEYMKIKGEFVYESEVRPEYAWYNGRMDRYVLGDEVTSEEQALNQPLGSRDDPKAKIWPFKVHRARQPYDPVNKLLIPPITAGRDGYWRVFDWSLAIKNGMELAGLPYSGHYEFAHTRMYWPTTHMVAPAEDAVECRECHSEGGRLDWHALGYDRDPAGGVRYDN